MGALNAAVRGPLSLRLRGFWPIQDEKATVVGMIMFPERKTRNQQYMKRISCCKLSKKCTEATGSDDESQVLDDGG